jgi:hypothetical protein
MLKNIRLILQPLPLQILWRGEKEVRLYGPFFLSEDPDFGFSLKHNGSNITSTSTRMRSESNYLMDPNLFNNEFARNGALRLQQVLKFAVEPMLCSVKWQPILVSSQYGYLYNNVTCARMTFFIAIFMYL